MDIKVIGNPPGSISTWEVHVDGVSVAGFNGPMALLAAQAVVRSMVDGTWSPEGRAFEYVTPYLWPRRF
jgi:hypothetical protein